MRNTREDVIVGALAGGLFVFSAYKIADGSHGFIFGCLLGVLALWGAQRPWK